MDQSKQNENMVMVTFDIDPSKSKIKDEAEKFAHYLKERYLTVDIFDANTKFFFGSCKIPLFELLRQQKNQIVRAKDCEIFNPENSQYNGSLQVILSNLGKMPETKDVPASSSTNDQKVGRQPTQGSKKVIVSKPMDANQINQAH